jgi:bifunctional DNA-binding transcriptional regulator/antitoxin component of YhaV-PrlF toxin-antitoxin module
MTESVTIRQLNCNGQITIPKDFREGVEEYGIGIESTNSDGNLVLTLIPEPDTTQGE